MLGSAFAGAGLLALLVTLFVPRSVPPAPSAHEPPPPPPAFPQQPGSPGLAQPNPASPEIDPLIRELANRLHSPETTAADDLAILDEFLRFYRRITGGNPLGLNEDITAELTGLNERQWTAFPPDHPALRNGQFTDRWGTPYFFHPVRADFMELRSAGPDRELFTPDDITWP